MLERALAWESGDRAANGGGWGGQCSRNADYQWELPAPSRQEAITTATEKRRREPALALNEGSDVSKVTQQLHGHAGATHQPPFCSPRTEDKDTAAPSPSWLWG